MLQAFNQLKYPGNTAQFKAAAPATRPATFRGAAEPTLPSPVVGPKADEFVKAERPQPTAAAQAGTLKRLLSDESRKANAAALYAALTGVKLPFADNAKTVQADQQADITAVARAIQKMSPADKLDLTRQVTGPESPFSKVAEKILINQQAPGLKDLLNCAKPALQQRSVEGGSAGMVALGTGLLMLSLVAPATLLFRPDLFGQVLAAAGAKLL